MNEDLTINYINMAKASLVLIMILSLSICRGQIQGNNGDYPKEILNTGTQKLYDKSKWFLYCIHSDREVSFLRSFKNDTKKIYYGTLSLRFDHIEVRKDTIEIDFYFYYKDYKIDEKIVEYLPYWGTVFTNNSDSIVMYSSRSHMRYLWKKCVNPKKCKYREQQPLQPEVIKYIKDNADKLDPWFRKEAIKRGVIKE